MDQLLQNVIRAREAEELARDKYLSAASGSTEEEQALLELNSANAETRKALRELDKAEGVAR